MEDTASKSLLLLGILLVAMPAGMLALPSILASDGEGRDIVKLTWQRTGGFAGLSETLVIEADGSATYTYDRFCFCLTEYVLAPDEMEELLDRVRSLELNRTYGAKAGAADYFVYRLTLEATSDEGTVEWVDDWAAEEALPGELLELQSYIEDLIVKIRESEDDGVQGAMQIALDFVVEAPTFSFDGIPETLRVTDVQILESFPIQYRVTISFVSRHPGYSDRTGQCLAQVETPHTARVTVVEDEVVSAILDAHWDMLRQEYVECPTNGDPDGTVVLDLRS